MDDHFAELIEPTARLNITWSGQNGDLPDPIMYDLSDAEVLRIAAEAVYTGVPGIMADQDVDLSNFVVDRFPATEELPPRVAVRPKTPFGAPV